MEWLPTQTTYGFLHYGPFSSRTLMVIHNSNFSSWNSSRRDANMRFDWDSNFPVLARQCGSSTTLHETIISLIQWHPNAVNLVWCWVEFWIQLTRLHRGFRLQRCFQLSAEFSQTYELQPPHWCRWYIDGAPIRTVDNNTNNYPNIPVKVSASIWDASEFATGPRSARIPCNYTFQVRKAVVN